MENEKRQEQSLKIMKDLSLQLNYDHPAFPVYIVKENLNAYYKMQLPCHWHEDVEFLMPLKGHITYSVNDRVSQIETGDAVFINARQLHSVFLEDGSDCEYLLAAFRPDAITSNEWLTERYISPITENFELEEYTFHKEKVGNQKFLLLLGRFYEVYQQKEICRELSAI